MHTDSNRPSTRTWVSFFCLLWSCMRFTPAFVNSTLSLRVSTLDGLRPDVCCSSVTDLSKLGTSRWWHGQLNLTSDNTFWPQVRSWNVILLGCIKIGSFCGWRMRTLIHGSQLTHTLNVDVQLGKQQWLYIPTWVHGPIQWYHRLPVGGMQLSRPIELLLKIKNEWFMINVKWHLCSQHFCNLYFWVCIAKGSELINVSSSRHPPRLIIFHSLLLLPFLSTLTSTWFSICKEHNEYDGGCEQKALK